LILEAIVRTAEFQVRMYLISQFTRGDCITTDGVLQFNSVGFYRLSWSTAYAARQWTAAPRSCSRRHSCSPAWSTCSPRPASIATGTSMCWRSASRSWAMLLARIYENCPLKCPLCGQAMTILTFILDKAVIERILRHIGEETTPPRVLPARSPRSSRCPSLRRPAPSPGTR
jgi:hypothetical protein